MRTARVQRTARDVSRELRESWIALDATKLGPRIAALVYLAGGLLLWGVEKVVPTAHGAWPLAPVAIVATIFGAIAIVLPWQRWPVRAQLVISLFAFVLFALGGALAGGPVGPYLAALPLPFVFAGFTQPPGTSIALAPFAAAALIVSARFDIDPMLVATMLFALPMSILVGETIAQAELHRDRAERRVERLLHAVRVLSRVADERTGAQLVAALAAELLGAQAVSVLLSDRPKDRRYLNRAYFGHPALAEAAPLLLDAYGDERGVRAGTTYFFKLKKARGGVRAAAIVPLPGRESVPVGLVIAMWGTSKQRLNAPARQAAELLSEEAGRMFERLRETAELEHDAETDPLTDLANRRTFTRALETMQPGDALVIFDLDHFKDVNDRYGHQEGDRTLRDLARCLRATARQVDCVARYGGEEFAVVLPEAGEEGARTMLKRIREAWFELQPMTTFSAGVAEHHHATSPRVTLRRADAALYEAKDAGRDCDVYASECESEIVLR